MTDHHRFLLSEHLTQIHHLEQAIERVTAELVRRFTPPSPPEEGSSSQRKQETELETASDSASTGSAILSASRFELVGSRRFAFEHSRHRRALGHWDLSRNRGQHAAISDRGAPGLLGWDLSGQSRKCWQTFIRENAQRQSLVTMPARSGGSFRFSSEAQLSRGTVSSHCQTARSETSCVAVAHSILVIIYHLLKNQTTYQEKGEAFFEEQERQGTEKRWFASFPG